jgi:hypothetical protein
MLYIENPGPRQVSIVLRTRNYVGALSRDERILDAGKGGHQRARFDLNNAGYSKGSKPRRADRLDLEPGATHIISDAAELEDEILDLLDQREALEAAGLIVSES